jgi:general secretion pathway protein G
MMSNSKKHRHHMNSAGFTLIEILLVVIILGILTSLVAIKLTGKTEDAQVAATKANINTIKVAISQYEMDTGKLPKNLKDLVKEEKHYLDRETVPQDEWGNDFKYYMKGDLVKIRSAGPDGSFDTEDDIVNE